MGPHTSAWATGTASAPAPPGSWPVWSVPGSNVQDEHAAVQHLYFHGFFYIAQLGRTDSSSISTRSMSLSSTYCRISSSFPLPYIGAFSGVVSFDRNARSLLLRPFAQECQLVQIPPAAPRSGIGSPVPMSIALSLSCTERSCIGIAKLALCCNDSVSFVTLFTVRLNYV